MRRFSLLFAATALLALLLQPAAFADEKQDLSVLYVGNVDTPRAQAFAEFLRQNFRKAETAARGGFDPKQAEGFDVVLLDWSQADRGDLTTNASPLGPRDSWTRPTVLLGSAGLLIATPWQTNGAYG